jgi:hypothetical protein
VGTKFIPGILTGNVNEEMTVRSVRSYNELKGPFAIPFDGSTDDTIGTAYVLIGTII